MLGQHGLVDARFSLVDVHWCRLQVSPTRITWPSSTFSAKARFADLIGLLPNRKWILRTLGMVNLWRQLWNYFRYRPRGDTALLQKWFRWVKVQKATDCQSSTTKKKGTLKSVIRSNTIHRNDSFQWWPHRQRVPDPLSRRVARWSSKATFTRRPRWIASSW